MISHDITDKIILNCKVSASWLDIQENHNRKGWGRYLLESKLDYL